MKKRLTLKEAFLSFPLVETNVIGGVKEIKDMKKLKGSHETPEEELARVQRELDSSTSENPLGATPGGFQKPKKESANSKKDCNCGANTKKDDEEEMLFDNPMNEAESMFASGAPSKEGSTQMTMEQVGDQDPAKQTPDTTYTSIESAKSDEAGQISGVAGEKARWATLNGKQDGRDKTATKVWNGYPDVTAKESLKNEAMTTKKPQTKKLTKEELKKEIVKIVKEALEEMPTRGPKMPGGGPEFEHDPHMERGLDDDEFEYNEDDENLVLDPEDFLDDEERGYEPDYRPEEEFERLERKRENDDFNSQIGDDLGGFVYPDELDF